MAAPNPTAFFDDKIDEEYTAEAGKMRPPSFAAAMEAERINQLASSLAGLQTRSAELRRYL